MAAAFPSCIEIRVYNLGGHHLGTHAVHPDLVVEDWLADTFASLGQPPSAIYNPSGWHLITSDHKKLNRSDTFRHQGLRDGHTLLLVNSPPSIELHVYNLAGVHLGTYAVHPDLIVAAWLSDTRTRSRQPAPCAYNQPGWHLVTSDHKKLKSSDTFWRQGLRDGHALTLVKSGTNSQVIRSFQPGASHANSPEDDVHRGLRFRRAFDEEQAREHGASNPNEKSSTDGSAAS